MELTALQEDPLAHKDRLDLQVQLDLLEYKEYKDLLVIPVLKDQ
jgi:hypothetical protein